MDISVIIPTYNRAHTLSRAVESVLVQSLRADEIVIVDDGSEDHTAELVRRRFPQCRYVHQLNQGVSAARNCGIRAAKGDWIALLDSDDAWLPDKLQRQCRQLQDNPQYRLCHTDEIWIRHGVRVNPMQKHAKSGGWIYQRCLPLCVISPSAVLLHRSLLDEAGLFDTALPACEDYDLWLRICAREPVLYIDEPLITKYGGHPDQLSHKHWGMDRFRIQALEKSIQSGGLLAEDRSAAIAMLIHKAGILAQGAEKRNLTQRVRYYRQLQQRYQSQLSIA